MLDEESYRRADSSVRDDNVGDLPGVGGDDVALRSALGDGRRALLITVGAMLGFGFAIFSTTALLASDIARHYDFSLRWLVQVAVLPGFTIVLVSQPLGNLADRPTTNRPRVLRWFLAVSVLALAFSAVAFNRWELLGVLAFTGAGVLATVPVQSSLLADAFPIRARPLVFAVYIAIGVAGFALAPVVVAASTALFDGDAEWRAPFVVLAVGVAVLAFAAGRLRDVQRGRAEVEEVFGDDRPIAEEHLTIAHALARFRQIATLRFTTLGLLAMGFALLSWGLWFNLWLRGHFHIGTTDRALLLALVALPAVCTTPFIGRITGRLFRRAPHRTM